MPALTAQSGLLVAALVAILASGAHAADAEAFGTLDIERIVMVPTQDGFYDATVGLTMRDAKLGKDGRIAFSIPIAHVHDVDEAITKIHEPVKTLGEDLQRAYSDIHREP